MWELRCDVCASPGCACLADVAACCALVSRPGCSMLEIWDLEDPSNAAHPPLCSTLLKDARPYFTVVFQNSMYRVLKVA